MWKVSNVVVVHKKGNRSVPSNYRPVSLLSVMGKVLESIIISNLTCHLESRHHLKARQFGLRKGCSSADLNLLLASEWSDALDQGRTAVLALDIAGAFDRVWHIALIELLRSVGVSRTLLELLLDYLQEWHMWVVHNGQQSSPYKIGEERRDRPIFITFNLLYILTSQIKFCIIPVIPQTMTIFAGHLKDF